MMSHLGKDKFYVSAQAQFYMGNILIDYLNIWFTKLKFQCCHQIYPFMCPKYTLGTNL